MDVIAKASGPDPRENVKKGEEVLVVGRIISIEGDMLTVEISGTEPSTQLRLNRYYILPIMNQ